MTAHKLRFAITMAWRETRAATGKFILVILSVALGAGALTAVTGFSESVQRIRGAEGTVVVLRIRHATGAEADLAVTRQLVRGR